MQSDRKVDVNISASHDGHERTKLGADNERRIKVEDPYNHHH